MHKLQLHIILAVLIALLFATVSHAQLPQVSRGLSYLTSSQNSDGTWGAGTSLVETTATTVSALETLKLLNQTDVIAYNTGVTWLQGQALLGVDPVAARIRVLALSDPNALMPAFDQNKGAWGGDEGDDTNILDTALALQALKAANYSDQTTIASALGYLTSTQNPDGGWGFAEGDDSSIYVTALASRTIQQFPQTTSLSTALNKATGYLLDRQNSDGGFGSPYSTVHETALAYNAVVAVITDVTALGKAVSFLTTNQSADGSWHQDPYSTALALRALHYSEYKPTVPLPPTTGTLTGKVVSAATREPLAGVTVSLANNPAIAATTDSGGTFKLDNIPQGSQQITLSLSGYATSSLLTTVVAGGISNLGTLTLAVASPSGTVQGIITDEATGAPLAGVIFKIYVDLETPGMAAVTAADGSFRIIDIAPGFYVLSASKEGYTSITCGRTISAGDVLDFSPVLTSRQLSSTTGEVIGKVIDGTTLAPIAGVTVTLEGSSTHTFTTNSNGQYHFIDVSQGTYMLSLKKPGYYDWYSNYTLSVFDGEVSYQGTQSLLPAPTATTITGKLTDNITNLPIQDADVTITGTSISTKTDSSGTYSIQGINILTFELQAAASGHFGKSYHITNQYHGNYSVDFTLIASQAANAKLVASAVDKAVYKAYDNTVITADIVNTDSLPVTLTVNATILDSTGNVITKQPFTETGMDGITTTAITIPPGEVKIISTNWGTGYQSPGTYQAIVKILDETTLTELGPMIVAQQSHPFIIEPTQAIDTLTITPLPRFTNLGATEQVGFQTVLVNRSNVQTALQFAFDWLGPDGSVLHSGSGTITAQPEEVSKTLLPDSFPYTFVASGVHPVQLKINSGPIPNTITGNSVIVAPGIRIEPTQSVSPETIIPDGDKRMHLNIRLQGVISK